MSKTILNSVKDFLGGIPEEDTSFDEEILTNINTAFFTLWNAGFGKEASGPIIIDKDSTIEQFVSKKLANTVISYISIKTKITFDPPASTASLESFRKTAEELEFRLSIFKSDITDHNSDKEDTHE